MFIKYGLNQRDLTVVLFIHRECPVPSLLNIKLKLFNSIVGLENAKLIQYGLNKYIQGVFFFLAFFKSIFFQFLQ